MIEIHESRQDGVDKATYGTEVNFEWENLSIENQTATNATTVNHRTNGSPQLGEAFGSLGSLVDSRYWGSSLQIRLVFRFVERHPRSTPSTRATVMVIHLLLVPPLLGSFHGVSEWWIESGGR